MNIFVKPILFGSYINLSDILKLKPCCCKLSVVGTFQKKNSISQMIIFQFFLSYTDLWIFIFCQCHRYSRFQNDFFCLSDKMIFICKAQSKSATHSIRMISKLYVAKLQKLKIRSVRSYPSLHTCGRGKASWTKRTSVLDDQVGTNEARADPYLWHQPKGETIGYSKTIEI